MPPPDVSRYRLSAEEAEHIFQTRVLPDEIPAAAQPAPPHTRPLAVIAVGQTGAGKTRLCQHIRGAMVARRGGRAPVHLIADTYKTYHPEYAGLVGSPATAHLASPAAGPDARGWLLMAAREAARRRLDVLLESACRHPDDFEALARVFRGAEAADYRLDVVVLAVPYGLSRLGLHMRYSLGLPDATSRNLPLRLTPTRVHDDSYDGLLRAAEFLDGAGVADHVLVVRRGGLVAHVQAMNAGTGARRLAAVLKAERQRPLLRPEVETVKEAYAALSQQASLEVDLGAIVNSLYPLMTPDDLRVFANDGAATMDHQVPPTDKVSHELPPLRSLSLGEETDSASGEIYHHQLA